jgi:hypothetical protein
MIAQGLYAVLEGCMLLVYSIIQIEVCMLVQVSILCIRNTLDVKGIIPMNKYWTISCSVCSYVHELCLWHAVPEGCMLPIYYIIHI